MATLLERIMYGRGETPARLPLPELVDGGDDQDVWTVEAGAPMVDLCARRLSAPSKGDDQSRRAQMHEIAHVALTPHIPLDEAAERIGCLPILLNAMEDARIHGILNRTSETKAVMSKGLPWGVRKDTRRKRIRQAALSLMGGASERVNVAALLAATANTPAYDVAQEEIATIPRCSELPELVRPYLDRISEPGATFADTLAVTNALNRRLLGSDAPPPPLGSALGGALQAAAEDGHACRDHDHGPPPDPLGDTLAGLGFGPSRKLAHYGSEAEVGFSALYGESDLANYARYAEPGRAGAMYVKRVPLPIRLRRPRKHAAVRKFATDDGGNIGAVHRLYLDGKILRRRHPEQARKRRGTLLVDTSGSMGLDSKDLEEVLSQAPQATVAVYGGMNEKGTLAIVAERGRRAETVPSCGYMNVVDLPALKWLADQPAPRIWISDGAVTGEYDDGHTQLIAPCHDVCVRANILRVENVTQLLREG